MEKRDRSVNLFFHRSSGTLLLFPYVCYMAGRASAAGDAVELSPGTTPARLGSTVVKLLRECGKADIEALCEEWKTFLAACWKGNRQARQKEEVGPKWQELLATWPALGKGPGTFLRQFEVCQISERDGAKMRKLVRVQPAPERGCTRPGDSTRVAIAAGPKALGEALLKFVAEEEE